MIPGRLSPDSAGEERQASISVPSLHLNVTSVLLDSKIGNEVSCVHSRIIFVGKNARIQTGKEIFAYSLNKAKERQNEGNCKDSAGSHSDESSNNRGQNPKSRSSNRRDLRQLPQTSQEDAQADQRVQETWYRGPDSKVCGEKIFDERVCLSQRRGW